MSTKMSTNGQQQRKSLAEQIDRLDTILDTLGEGLNQAVASAVEEVVSAAVTAAVQAAVVEVLTNPDLQQRLRQALDANTPPSKKVSWWERLGEKARSCWSWLTGTAKSTWSKIAGAVKTAIAKVRTMAQPVMAATTAKVQQVREQVVRRARSGWMLTVALAALAKRVRTHLAVALGVGVLVGVAFYLGGREIASVGCGLAGFAGSLATGAVNRLRGMLPFLASSKS